MDFNLTLLIMLLISQSDGSRVSNFRRNLLIKISLSLKKNNLQGNNFSTDLIDNIVGNSIQYTVITHFSKKNYSHEALYFLVCLGFNKQKSVQKSKVITLITLYIYIYSSTRHLQSLGTISFVVSGNEPAKIYAKVN